MNDVISLILRHLLKGSIFVPEMVPAEREGDNYFVMLLMLVVGMWRAIYRRRSSVGVRIIMLWCAIVLLSIMVVIVVRVVVVLIRVIFVGRFGTRAHNKYRNSYENHNPA